MHVCVHVCVAVWILSAQIHNPRISPIHLPLELARGAYFHERGHEVFFRMYSPLDIEANKGLFIDRLIRLHGGE